MTDTAPAPAPAPRERFSTALGFSQATAAFAIWGFFPLYLKAFATIGLGETLAHRVLWSWALLAVILAFRKRLGASLRALANPRVLLNTAVAAALLVLNWYFFIGAIFAERVAEVSLGYYLIPLVNGLLGAVVLRERLSPLEVMAIAISGLAVAGLAVAEGRLPLFSLVLAFSFPIYGVIHRKTASRPLEMTCSEMMLASLIAVPWLVFFVLPEGGGNFARAGTGTYTLLLFLLGPLSMFPLILFHLAVGRLRYITVGFLSYLGPSLQFFLAFAVFGEEFTTARLLAFFCIWGALGLFSYQTLRRGMAEAHAKRSVSPR